MLTPVCKCILRRLFHGQLYLLGETNVAKVRSLNCRKAVHCPLMYSLQLECGKDQEYSSKWLDSWTDLTQGKDFRSPSPSYDKQLTPCCLLGPVYVILVRKSKDQNERRLSKMLFWHWISISRFNNLGSWWCRWRQKWDGLLEGTSPCVVPNEPSTRMRAIYFLFRKYLSASLILMHKTLNPKLIKILVDENPSTLNPQPPSMATLKYEHPSNKLVFSWVWNIHQYGCNWFMSRFILSDYPLCHFSHPSHFRSGPDLSRLQSPENRRETQWCSHHLWPLAKSQKNWHFAVAQLDQEPFEIQNSLSKVSHLRSIPPTSPQRVPGTQSCGLKTAACPWAWCHKPRGSPLDDSKKQVSSVQNPQRRPFKNCLVHSISGCIPHIFHGFWESPISTNNYGPTLRYQWLLSNQSTAPGAARSRCASFLPKPRCCNQAAHALLQHWSWPISGAAPTMGVETNGHGEVGWKFWQYLCICNVVLAISKHIIQVCLYKYVMCICQYSICWIGMCECRYGV